MGKLPATLEVRDDQDADVVAITNHTAAERHQVLPFVAVYSDQTGTMCTAPDKICGAVRRTLQGVQPVPVVFRLLMLDAASLSRRRDEAARLQALRAQLTVEPFEHDNESQRRAVESFVGRLKRRESKRPLWARQDMLTDAGPGTALVLKNGLGRVRGKLDWTQSGKEGHLDGFVIEENWRRLGGGKKLLKEAENRARREGVEFLNLEVQPGSEDFYKRMGYGRGWYDGKILTRKHTFRVVPLQDAADAAGYAALRQGHRAEQADRLRDEYIPKEAKGDPEVVLVLEESGRAVGYATGGGDSFDSRFWRVNEVAVEDERAGGGRMLVGSMEEVAARNGRRFILAIATRFFVAMGYQRFAVGWLAVKGLGLKRKTPDP